jgi:signal transduction histidine kinase/response regulator RpfG family c-di-GMP phosphodiesterase
MTPLPSAKDGEEKGNILIVDDRLDKVLAYEVMLAELNQNIVRARSGKEALRCLLQQDFAVILLDVNMPGMDGFETAAMIRQRPRSETTPIIFISAISDTENYVARGYSLGAVDYILTPVVPEILRAKIAVFVDLSKKTEQVKRQAEERAHEQAARSEAERRQERLAFLAEASNVLAGSLEYQETFQNSANLSVPRLADFCLVHVANGSGTLDQASVAHLDLKDDPRLRKVAEEYPASSAANYCSNRTFQTGESKILCDTTDDALKQLFDREADRDFVRSLGISSVMAVPIRTRDGVVAAITMMNTRPERKCGPDELSLAEELAQRAALALDNASLYTAAQNARAEAERANLAKDQFLAMLSHELRTPLTPVLISILALEQEDGVPENIREILQMIHRNVELEARLIDDLLDLTRISKGKVQLSLEIVDAHTLLRNALEIYQVEIAQKHLALHLDLAAQKVHLQADPARLQQIFWNLIKNAVKFTPNGGQICVSTSNDAGDQLRVEITDTGFGIEPGALPKIFDAFEQAGRAQLGGLGLGLAISKALVEAHKGTITPESAGRNKGAKFTLTFPTCEKTDGQAAPAAEPKMPQRQTMRILLVEDHEDTNRSLTNLLRRRGYHVQSAVNLQSALDLSGREEFDVLISDLGLPDGSGIDLMRSLHSERPILGIALTGFGMEDDIRKSHAAGFKHHLVKPIDLNKLDSLIQEGAAALSREGNPLAAGRVV